jgi:tetrapyrrole methylase family protein/MazG family protein
MREFEDLVALMNRLRDEGGCPWDREQTPQDLRGYLLEEAYEVIDAIDDGRPQLLAEELGDLLFQIVFLARIHAERGDFSIADVASAVTRKMTRRHPHVFADSTASTSAEVLRQWEEIKRREKEEAAGDPDAPVASAIDGIPRSLPALLRAERLGTKASRVGFDWADARGVLDKIDEELGEFRAAALEESGARAEEEFGDLLLSLVSLARHLGIHAEGALQTANDRFARRFRKVEELLRRRGKDAATLGPDDLERLWQEAKRSQQP